MILWSIKAGMLRPYQQQAIDDIRAHFGRGVRKVLLHMPTGSGKTVIFSEILKTSKVNCLMVVRGRKLVDQCSQRLTREGIEHSIIMNGRETIKSRISICSIDTLISRKLTPDADLIVYDECHLAISKGYFDFINKYPNAYHIGVTATPYVATSIRHFADVVVNPISTDALVQQGYLVKPIYYGPACPDVSKVKTSKSDYNVVDLDDVLNQSKIVGDLVLTWKKFAQNRSTLIFAVTVAHSKNIVQQFMEAGIPAKHCDADTPDDLRNDIIFELENDKIKIICNVGIYGTGVDIPSLGCVMMARPTKSVNLYLQQAGRGTRKVDGKNDFILLDFAGNVFRHGFINEEREVNLDGLNLKKENKEKVRTCKQCFAVFDPKEKKCPLCDFVPLPEVVKKIKTIHGDLASIDENMMKTFFELKKLRKEKNYKRGWIFHKMKDEFGEMIAEALCPKRNVPSWVFKK